MTDIIIDLGKKYLQTIESTNTDIINWKTKLGAYVPIKDQVDDGYTWLTCILALKAVEMGNFGVGCVLVDSNYNIVAKGHNKVFNPYFRSDLHAEMVVMDEFEDTHKDIVSMSGYTLYTSLESCPMCMTRLIKARVGKVLHVAPDIDGGMVNLSNNLPGIWRDLLKGQNFQQARCSKQMINAAEKIFSINASGLYLKLKNRSY